jgi:hypothetical protein
MQMNSNTWRGNVLQIMRCGSIHFASGDALVAQSLVYQDHLGFMLQLGIISKLIDAIKTIFCHLGEGVGHISLNI